MSEKTNQQGPTVTADKMDGGGAIASGAKKKGGKGWGKFLLLCGHPLHVDPRILYMADTFARLGEVTILGCSDYGGKNEGAVVYKRHACRSFSSARKRSVSEIVTEYWPWFNPRNLFILWMIIRVGWKRRFGPKMRHLHDLTLGFLPYAARSMTNKSFDFIVCCDSYMMDSAMAVRRMNPKAQFIFDAHEVFYSEINQDPARERMLRLVEERWLRHVDRMFVVSKGIQALYVKRNPDLRGRVHCLPNAIPFCGVKQDAIIGNMSGTVRFVFQGGYHKTRGIDRLLEIWAALPACNASLTLRMVGHTNDELEALKALMADGNARNEVIIEEPVNEDELVQACIGYDVGVIPYPYEVCLGNLYCCPNKFGQYLNAGCAVLATNSRYLRRLTKDLDCGWAYDPNNVKGTIELICSIVADRQALHQKRLRALHHAEFTYNWDIMDRVVETAIKR